MPNYLRATQQNSMLQFQATQMDVSSGDKTVAKAVAATKAYNWLTQSSMDTLQSSLFSGTLSETQSALLFSAPSSTRRTTGAATDDSKSSSSGDDTDRDIYRLRRRFVKDVSATAQSRFFARKQVIYRRCASSVDVFHYIFIYNRGFY